MKAVKKKTHAFLLLELMIGLALLMLVLVPFIQIPSQSLESELITLQRIALHQFSERIYAQVKEYIYTHQISLPLKDKKYWLPEETIALPIKEFAKHPFIRKSFLTAKHKKGKDGIDYFLVTLHVSFASKSKHSAVKKLAFTHKLFVEQKASTQLLGHDSALGER